MGLVLPEIDEPIAKKRRIRDAIGGSQHIERGAIEPVETRIAFERGQGTGILPRDPGECRPAFYLLEPKKRIVIAHRQRHFRDGKRSEGKNSSVLKRL
jgi:hypothetical protein